MTDLGEQQLRESLQKQLARLQEELADLEELKADMSEAEYGEMKSSLQAKLDEADDTLRSMDGGSLLLGERRTTTTPSRHVGRDVTAQLREEIRGLERQLRSNAISNIAYTDAKVALLQQLSRAAQLTEAERKFLDSHATTPQLVEASGPGTSEKLLQAAAKRA